VRRCSSKSCVVFTTKKLTDALPETDAAHNCAFGGRLLLCAGFVHLSFEKEAWVMRPFAKTNKTIDHDDHEHPQ
jgi:hypothetical protein